MVVVDVVVVVVVVVVVMGGGGVGLSQYVGGAKGGRGSDKWTL